MKTGVALCVAIGLTYHIGCGSDGASIITTGPEPTKVYKNAECDFDPNNTVIGELPPGDTVKTLGYETLKDHMAYKIKLPDGRTGWVTLGDNCDRLYLP